MARKKKKPSSPKSDDGTKLIARNKRATFEYEILEKLECGVVLYGSEVKSLREGHVSFADSYVRVRNGELVIYGMNIAEYAWANRLNHDPTRFRKLLAHKKEIAKLAISMDAKGLTVIPLSMYFKRGKVKIKVGLARGKANHDKRESLKKKDFDRHKQRIMRNYSK